MGFEPARVDWALQASRSGGGLQAALDHLEAHQDEPVPEKAADAPAETAQGEGASQSVEQSIRCNDCGKLFRDMNLAMYHAEKSGHEAFEETSEAIKPLSQEEKDARLAELRAKLAEKRSKQSVEDAETQRANEKIRRKAGQDASRVREELEHKERIKQAEQKRNERIADMKAKARVRQQIEEDKRARAEKAAREKALRSGQPLPGAMAPGDAHKPTAPRVTPSNANETRLRVRAPGGTWMGTLSADATLADVERAVAQENKASGATSLTFSTTFPRKVFSDAEREQTLRALGLVPNAALEAAAKQSA